MHLRHTEFFVFPRENKKLRMVHHQEFFVFPQSPRYQITEYSSPHGLLMKILGMFGLSQQALLHIKNQLFASTFLIIWHTYV